MELKRKKNIENAIKKRKELIDNSFNKEKKEILSINPLPSVVLRGNYKTIADEEKGKYRQLMILKNKIKFDLKLSEKEKKNNEKYLNQEKVIEGIKQLKQKIVREKLLKQKLYDMQRMERLKIDYDEYLKYQNNIREREKRFENNVEKTQRERKEENEIKKKLSRQKENEFRIKLEQKTNLENELINDKRELLKLKYEKQKYHLDVIKRGKSKENQEKSRIYEEKTVNAINSITKNENNNSNIYMNKIHSKEKTAREIRNKLSEEKNIKIREQYTTFMEKEKKIYDLFQQKEMNLQKKGEDFYKKYQNISLRKKEIDNKNKQNIRRRNIVLQEKENKCKEARLRDEKEKELYRRRLFKKINNSQSQMIIRKRNNDMEIKDKYMELSLKMEDIYENLKAKERLIELKNAKKMKKFEEKDKKLEQMRYIKLKLQDQRRRINKNLELDKERIINKYSSLKIKEHKSVEDVLKELFPEDYNVNNNAISYREFNSRINLNSAD